MCEASPGCWAVLFDCRLHSSAIELVWCVGFVGCCGARGSISGIAQNLQHAEFALGLAACVSAEAQSTPDPDFIVSPMQAHNAFGVERRT